MRPTLVTPGLADLAAPFAEAAVIGLPELHALDALAGPLRETDPHVLLGLAFAAAAPGRGHVGVNLARVREDALAEAALAGPEREAAVNALPWPADGAAWMARVVRSPLVATDGSATPRPFVHHGSLLLTWRHHRYQQRLREALRARLAVAPVAAPPAALAGLAELVPAGPGAEELRAALRLVLERTLTVVTGGPGTGKTSLVHALLRAVAALGPRDAEGRPSLRAALAAPTGKAAVRMTRALAEGAGAPGLDAGERAWLLGLEATTLHRLLGLDPRHPSRFRHDPTWPLSADLVVVDEVSMVDLALMTRLLEAVRPGARLVLLGDPDQLASVQAGCVLADLRAAAERAEAGAALRGCLARLTHPRRFGADSGLGRLATAIAAGQPDGISRIADELEAGALPGVRLLAPPAAERPAGLPPEALLLALEGYRPYLAALGEGPRPGEPRDAFLWRVLERHERFRVLCVHRGGPLGVEGLNAALGLALGLGQPDGRPRRPGLSLLVTENSHALGRMNGDLGFLAAVEGRLQAVFPAAEPSRVELLEAARLPACEPAFALTVHKCQGSQFDEVLVVLPRRTSPLLTRELIYTAVTRARRSLTLVAEPAQLRAALSRRAERASTLAADLAALTPPA